MAPASTLRGAKRRQRITRGIKPRYYLHFLLPNRRTMPTRVDVAAEAAQNEISSAIEQMEHNIALSSPSSPSTHQSSFNTINNNNAAASPTPSQQHQLEYPPLPKKFTPKTQQALDYLKSQTTNDPVIVLDAILAGPKIANDDKNMPSSLFRDEVQQHEMRYLDRLLLGKKPAADNKSQSKGADAADGNQYKAKAKASFGYSPLQVPPNRSKIASILSPYDVKDGDENDTRKSNDQTGTHAQTKINRPQDMHNKQPQNKVTRKNIPTHRSSIGCKIHKQISTLIHHTQPKRSNTSGYSKNSRKAAVPSRNKRRQMNHKFIQRAQRSSRRVIAKMVKLGRRCTRNLTTIKNVINHSVKKAIANATSAHNNGLAQAKRGGINHIDESRKVGGAVDNVCGATSIGENNERSTAPVRRVPPKDAFSSLMFRSTERMSSDTVTMVKKTMMTS